MLLGVPRPGTAKLVMFPTVPPGTFHYLYSTPSSFEPMFGDEDVAEFSSVTRREFSESSAASASNPLNEIQADVAPQHPLMEISASPSSADRPPLADIGQPQHTLEPQPIEIRIPDAADKLFPAVPMSVEPAVFVEGAIEQSQRPLEPLPVEIRIPDAAVPTSVEPPVFVERSIEQSQRPLEPLPVETRTPDFADRSFQAMSVSSDTSSIAEPSPSGRANTIPSHVKASMMPEKRPAAELAAEQEASGDSVLPAVEPSTPVLRAAHKRPLETLPTEELDWVSRTPIESFATRTPSLDAPGRSYGETLRQLQQAVDELQAQVAQQETERPILPTERIVIVKSVIKPSQAPRAYWARRYLSRFHLKLLR